MARKIEISCVNVQWSIELKRAGRRNQQEICTVWLYLILSSFFWGFAISSIKFMTFDAPSNYSAIFDTFELKKVKISFVSCWLLTSCLFILQNQFILMSQTVLIFNTILTTKIPHEREKNIYHSFMWMKPWGGKEGEGDAEKCQKFI